MSRFEEQLEPEHLEDAAEKIGCDIATIQAVIEVESQGSGFISGGAVPKILYERHIAARALRDRGLDVAKTIQNYPQLKTIVSFLPYSKGGYGKLGQQWVKFNTLAEVNYECAVEACSWGAFQVLGRNYKDLGYDSPDAFKRQMETPEGQLQAFVRFVVVNKLQDKLIKKDWAGFAASYNGKHYKKFGYHWKLAKAYARFIQKDAPKKPLRKSRTLQSATAMVGVSSVPVVTAFADKAEQVSTLPSWLFYTLVGQLALTVVLAVLVGRFYLQDRGTL